ncbi:uncharacterized protein LOC131144422 isoform X2 [Malania oleifera]|uniref:uncharacterized protein LOC131144422 isoform X2 n=1 Tax=Malania oleifera TaxID=397392 RepID=UPI0025ADBFDE|nr:uncharacterized protein LOC131144422 isoform X2 [Malania oleifera]
MGEIKVTKSTMDVQKNNRNGHLKVIDPAVSRFFTQLPQKFHSCIMSRLNKFAKDNEETNSESRSLGKEKGSYAGFEVNLEKQLQAWKDNPIWTNQPPEIKVSVPKGSLCNLNVKVNVGLPPDAVYNIVTDPDSKRVFKNIKMKFKQVKTGFMKEFQGLWRVEPVLVDEKFCFPFKPKTLADYYACTGGKGRIGSKVSLDQLIQPAIVPPPPISWYLRGITAKTTEMLINDLLAEAARIRGCNDIRNSDAELGASEDVSGDLPVEEICNIKERWALHRRNAKKHRRRSPLKLKSTFS